MSVCRSALIFLLLLSPLVQAAPLSFQPEEYLEALEAAREDGVNEAITILGFLLAVLTVAIPSIGYGLYRLLRTKLGQEVVDEFREGEVRSLTSLGTVNYRLYFDGGGNIAEKLAALTSAIAHTTHALNIALHRLSDKNDSKVRLAALASTNLAYFYVLLSDLEEDSNLQDKYRESASRALDKAGVYIDAVIRTKESKDDIEWYNVNESRLWVRYRTTPVILKKDQILVEMNALIENLSIPASWREKMQTKWSELTDSSLDEEV